MTKFTKAIFAVLIILMLAGSVAAIGWIGFQEHFRLLARSFQKDTADADSARAAAEAQAQLEDHALIETAQEAEQVLDLMENRLRDLERDDLPEE